MQHILILFGTPNSAEIMVTLIVLLLIIGFIFKAGQWYGQSKKK